MSRTNQENEGKQAGGTDGGGGSPEFLGHGIPAREECRETRPDVVDRLTDLHALPYQWQCP